MGGMRYERALLGSGSHGVGLPATLGCFSSIGQKALRASTLVLVGLDAPLFRSRCWVALSLGPPGRLGVKFTFATTALHEH